MATSTSQSTKKANNNAEGDRRRQDLRGIIKTHLDTHFKSTLATQNDMVNIFLALMLRESSFDNGANSAPPAIVAKGSKGETAGYSYLYSSVIQNKLKEIEAIRSSGSSTDDQKEAAKQQYKNIYSGLTPFGLTQTMGWNHVKGASSTGKCLIESARPDLAPGLVIAPGDSLKNFLLGDSNMSKNVLAGLIVLESKWNSCKPSKDGWRIGDYVYPLRISAAVSAYLGLGKADQLNTTPGAYTASIVGGSFYAKANGASAPVIRDSSIQYASSDGPLIALSSTTRVTSTGCKESQSQPSKA